MYMFTDGSPFQYWGCGGGNITHVRAKNTV